VNVSPLSVDLAKMLHDWRNAPSNTASASPPPAPDPWAFLSAVTIPSDT
jgi:hypothetical protein